jgi:hypothetical protein
LEQITLQFGVVGELLAFQVLLLGPTPRLLPLKLATRAWLWPFVKFPFFFDFRRSYSDLTIVIRFVGDKVVLVAVAADVTACIMMS